MTQQLYDPSKPAATNPNDSSSTYVKSVRRKMRFLIALFT